MIDFYTWNTPNGQKVAIMLEELQLHYEIHPVNIKANEQFQDTYLKINPNSKIPAIIDRDGPDHKPMTLFESGAILIYLAEKTGRLLPSNLRERYFAMQWLMFQMGGVGPMFGQLNHFIKAAKEKLPYAIERYRKETLRLYGVMDKHLNNTSYFAADYSIADIALFPWIAIHQRQGIDIDEFPNVKRFWHEVAERPAVQRGMAKMHDLTGS